MQLVQLADDLERATQLHAAVQAQLAEVVRALSSLFSFIHSLCCGFQVVRENVQLVEEVASRDRATAVLAEQLEQQHQAEQAARTDAGAQVRTLQAKVTTLQDQLAAA